MLRHCYLRITASGWSEKKQRAVFAKAGYPLADEIEENIYIDRYPNKKAAVRFPLLASIINILRKGDEVVIATHHILGGGNYMLSALEEITKRGALIRVLSDGKRYGAKDVFGFAKLAMKQVSGLKSIAGLAARGPGKMGGRKSLYTNEQKARIRKAWLDKELTQDERIALLKQEGIAVSKTHANRIANKKPKTKRKRKASE